MLDHWRPLTAILAATCLWAVVLLVLALIGLGGRVAPLPDDPSKVPPVPAVNLQRVAPRLGAPEEYAEVGSRPLLIADRRPAPIGPVAGEGASNDLDVALTSVLITPRLQMAILTDNNGGASRRVRVGEVVQGTGWTLVDVKPRQATLSGPSGERILELRVYNGLGGAAPTPVAAAGSDPEAPQPPAEPDPNVASAPVATAPPPAAPQPTDTLTQEQQIEAIRKRIEARRAQMRAEAARQQGDKR
jgi:general secretion pathway protein N